jgi:hypothetical protein
MAMPAWNSDVKLGASSRTDIGVSGTQMAAQPQPGGRRHLTSFALA